MKIITTILILCLSLYIKASTYYVATNGNDSRTKTQAQNILTPWATLEYGCSQLVAGDTLFIRGGTYTITSMIDVANTDGTAENPIVVINYQDEIPVMDCDGLYRLPGMWIRDVSYWKFEGFTICNAEQDGGTSPVYGILVGRCDHLYFDEITIYNIGGSGFRTEQNSDQIFVTNCDSYLNYDPTSPIPGNAADGFQVIGSTSADTTAWAKVHFKGCRSWANSDDGIAAGYGCYTVIDSCWAWDNGYEGLLT